MSYILDALRRAEAQRTRGRPPGLHESAGGAVIAPSPAADVRRPLIFVLLLLLIVGLLAAGYAVLRWQIGPDSSAPAAVTATAVGATKAEAVTTAQVPGAAAVVAAPSSPAIEPVLGVLGLPRKAVIAAERADPPKPASSKSEQNSPAPAVANAATKSAAESRVPATSSQPALASAGRGALAAAPILRRQELPPEIERTLPPISVSGTVYSSDPTQRMLVVNGELWREGDQIQPELILEQIRRRDAVLRYRGYRFTVGP